MTDEQKQRLEKALWGIANTLRGKMNADEFRDYRRRTRAGTPLMTLGELMDLP